MILKWLFDRIVAFVGLLFLWPVLLIVAILIKIKMPGGLLSLYKIALAKEVNSSSATSSVQ